MIAILKLYDIITEEMDENAYHILEHVLFILFRHIPVSLHMYRYIVKQL